MSVFLKNIFFFSVFFMTVVLLFFIGYIYVYKISIKDVPAANFSNSYSFNEKILFLHNNSKNAKILAIGSSMSLNNLHSQTVINELKSDQFLSTASWGMSLRDDYLFLKTLTKIYEVKSLIIVSNMIDFTQPDKAINYFLVEDYLKASNLSSDYLCLKHFNLKYYLTNLRFAKKVRTATHDYDYLKYDKFGTVNYGVNGFNINRTRWTEDHITSNVRPTQYTYLDSLSTFCKKNGIKLMVFQSPLRQGLYSRLCKSKRYTLQAHINKVEDIIKKNNQIFVNSNEVAWADNLFADAIHFNEVGARLFTKFCFDKTKISISQ